MKRALDQSDAIVEEFQADGNALSDALAEVSDDRDHIVREASALAQKNKQLEAKLAANNVVGTLETDDFRERLARVAKEKHDAELELRSVRSSLCKALGDTTTKLQAAEQQVRTRGCTSGLQCGCASGLQCGCASGLHSL